MSELQQPGGISMEQSTHSALRRSFIHQDVLHRHRAYWGLSEISVARVRVHPTNMGNSKQGFFFTKNTFPLLCFVSYHLLKVCVVVFNHLSHWAFKVYHFSCSKPQHSHSALLLPSYSLVALLVRLLPWTCLYPVICHKYLRDGVWPNHRCPCW